MQKTLVAALQAHPEHAALMWKARKAELDLKTDGTAGAYLVSRVALNYGTLEAIFFYEVIPKEVIASRGRSTLGSLGMGYKALKQDTQDGGQGMP